MSISNEAIGSRAGLLFQGGSLRRGDLLPGITWGEVDWNRPIFVVKIFFMTCLKKNDPKDSYYTFLQHFVCLNSSKSQINFKPCIGIGGGGRWVLSKSFFFFDESSVLIYEIVQDQFELFCGSDRLETEWLLDVKFSHLLGVFHCFVCLKAFDKHVSQEGQSR